MKTNNIAYDSRKVKSGDLFVAIPGLKVDGHDFIAHAIKAGASTIVAEKDFDAPPSVKKVIVDNSRKALAELSNRFYDCPSKKLKIIGITGTNGKTTTAYLIESILSAAGFRVGLIGTVENKIGGKSIDSKLTTPESLELQELLAEMLRAGVTHVVMEVSSHALAQYRVYGCDFDVAIYTNLTHDHLDFHKDMNSYLEEKKKLFKMLKPSGAAIINVDDPYSKDIASVVETEVVFYGFKEGRHELRSAKHSDLDGTLKDFKVDNINSMQVKIDSEEIKTSLIGEFNVYNILAAYQCGLYFNLSPKIIKHGLEKAKVPGRFELFKSKNGFYVIVDFAHSPDALKKLLKTVKPFVEGRLILVFGCPGDRDKTKRPIMGRIASEAADLVFVTTDDPHAEDPQNIINDIKGGMINDQCPISNIEFQKANYFIIDRKMAIQKALELANKGDIVVIAGRGHEKYQDFNGEKVYLDDREVVKAFLLN
ncbi:UDP-N-acetylmuramoyl-L-alanyl-D-glutamate--2,6-diaminopimelate ligase [candidate division WOR-1 bacterium RIFOXYD2_FULL_36_8]|uniref:UDP-N-acetylmuramyl-tripeptide synthetase n=1 Tax=candidate division WOR-1 bacterium RIFOXYB2_FULL_36_35 TaxID=1802578 RepID=A0A1F4S8F6_UNCSA|nr:MAG: UDP-N-acetylmuramoyl-L-alanyl-D-glutamate--2,6-diaminopimelate ligase [candidate division WOR-1 bacterium RIFOXYA2_FULL_36_21]OGC15339.1 MAG: UDP-N-acetylmuramoyl-L-alanyl-D-glutamate--2,6-diaminopimelate ligase [candidate division WOR-1 bacterium RIFOXYA12_FULL_36_13]OGC16681.1 MAG: UDP-N-acetylmuramoyl-L-alanyl-D-glutamate--2,6-diaminopimelate ligase [candidate division WOR-1 bacterium RIFOXYB2_FULL_36_35]OGC38534.1 MAG: UDP-N-acetylmuramoyl-L-alanyl-D-glutamate--2,6-diaminopimelate li